MSTQKSLKEKYIESFRSRRTWIGIGIVLVIGIYAWNEDEGTMNGNYDEGYGAGGPGYAAQGNEFGNPAGQATPASYGAGNPGRGSGNGFGSGPGSGSENTFTSGQGNGGGRVQIIDRGLQMVRATVDIPAGWNLQQDIATNPQTGEPIRYQVDLFGPEGQVIRNGGPTIYASHMGQSFEQMWPQVARRLLQGVVENPNIGSLNHSQLLQQVHLFRQFAQGGQAQGLEAPVRGTRNGRPFSGRVYVIHAPMGQVGMFLTSLVASPDELWPQTESLNLRISNSTQVSPQFDQAMAQISQRKMGQMQNDHQRRMAANQAQFDATQRAYRSTQQAYDQSNQSWMNDFRSSGGGYGETYGGSDYSSHNALIDGIHEQQTFQDPYSGQQMQMDGQYDYNYTDGLGNYYGTNDPSFNPNSLQGNWTETQPLGR